MHYPTLPADVLRRAAARGLDLEGMTDAFLADIRAEGFPPDLLAVLGGESLMRITQRRLVLRRAVGEGRAA